jgi:hypothetical protein
MPATKKLAEMIKNDPNRALRVANLLSQGITIARAIKYVELADKETYR